MKKIDLKDRNSFSDLHPCKGDIFKGKSVKLQNYVETWHPKTLNNINSCF